MEKSGTKSETRPEAKKDNSKKASLYFILAALIILGLWALNWWWVDYHFCTLEQGGQFGDRFGAATSLFGGLTILGLLYTIYLQHQDLQAARETNRLSVQELTTSNQRFEEQNKVLNIQKFETTFFNLLDNLEKTKKTNSHEQRRDIYSAFYQTFSKLNCVFLNDLRDAFTKEVGGHATSTHFYYYQTNIQFLELFDVTISLIIDEVDIPSQTKYFQIIAALIPPEEKKMLWYYANLREDRQVEKYKLFEKPLFGNLNPFHPSHEQILRPL
jgi:hypothetical protein